MNKIELANQGKIRRGENTFPVNNRGMIQTPPATDRISRKRCEQYPKKNTALYFFNDKYGHQQQTCQEGYCYHIQLTNTNNGCRASDQKLSINEADKRNKQADTC